jgi:hypothetical protein
MKKYIYTDHNDGDSVIEIIASDIMSADKEYQKITNRHPAKMPYVGCQIKEITNDHF